MVDYTEEDVVTYVPEADDNRHQEEPWEVDLVPMTAAEQRKYMMAAAGAKDANKMKQANAVLARIFRDRVLRVVGLLDIRGQAIETGAELFERSETEYIDEIWAALTKASTLRAGLKNA